MGELKAQEYTAAFLNIGDLDEKAVSDFIGKVCKLRGYDVPGRFSYSTGSLETPPCCKAEKDEEYGV